MSWIGFLNTGRSAFLITDPDFMYYNNDKDNGGRYPVSYYRQLLKCLHNFYLAIYLNQKYIVLFHQEHRDKFSFLNIKTVKSFLIKKKML